MKKWALPLLLCSAMVGGSASASGRYLRSGPMVGYSEPKEVLLWVQTNAPLRNPFFGSEMIDCGSEVKQ